MKARRIERENFYFLSIVCFHHMEYGNGNRYYYINDHLFTPQKMIDTSGNTVWQADWDSFGEVSLTVNTIENSLRFPGQYYDSETGFYYNFHRYYMPEIGRYLREDPAGGNGNYFYVNSNPVSFVDYSGLIPSNSDFHCWIVCDWAHLPFEAGLVFHLLHCWLEWGRSDPGLATENSVWGMHGFDLNTRFYFYNAFGLLGLIMDRVDPEHGERMGIFFYELPEDCCCRITHDPPRPELGVYGVGGVCNTALSDYLKKVCPRVGYGPPPIEEGNMFGWGWWWGWSWRPVSYFF